MFYYKILRIELISTSKEHRVGQSIQRKKEKKKSDVIIQKGKMRTKDCTNSLNRLN